MNLEQWSEEKDWEKVMDNPLSNDIELDENGDYKLHDSETEEVEFKTGAEVLLQNLINNDITNLVTTIAGDKMTVLKGLAEYREIKLTYTSTVQGSINTAIAYQKATDKLMAVAIRNPFEISKSALSLSEAKAIGNPLLLINNQLPLYQLQNKDILNPDLTFNLKPTFKDFQRPILADHVAESINYLIKSSREEAKRPVIIDFPSDVQLHFTNRIKPQPESISSQQKINHSNQITHSIYLKETEKLVRLLKSSNRPVIIIGAGFDQRNLSKKLDNLIKEIQIPLVCSVHASSTVLSNNPFYLGLVGDKGHPQARIALQKSDLILALETTGDNIVTQELLDLKHTPTIVQVQSTGNRFYKNIPLTLNITGSTKELFIDLHNSFEGFIHSHKNPWFQFLDLEKIKYNKSCNQIYNYGYNDDKAIIFAKVISDLSNLTQGSDNIVADMDEQNPVISRFYKFAKHNSFFDSLSQSGHGIATSIGVKTARNDTEVWCICSQKNLHSNLQELVSLEKNDLKINIIVINSNTQSLLGGLKNIFSPNSYKLESNDFFDLTNISKAYGLEYKIISKVENVLPALTWQQSMRKSSILEFVCDVS